MKKQIRNILYLIFPLSLLALQGCIENDIPYPRIPAQILSVDAIGLTQAPIINNETQSVELILADTVDLKRVKITTASITKDATVTPVHTTSHRLPNLPSHSIKTTSGAYQPRKPSNENLALKVR